MRTLFSTFLVLSLGLFNTEVQSQSSSVTDENINEISQRLENYSIVELVERRDILLKSLDEEDEDSDAGLILGTRSQ